MDRHRADARYLRAVLSQWPWSRSLCDHGSWRCKRSTSPLGALRTIYFLHLPAHLIDLIPSEPCKLLESILLTLGLKLRTTSAFCSQRTPLLTRPSGTAFGITRELPLGLKTGGRDVHQLSPYIYMRKLQRPLQFTWASKNTTFMMVEAEMGEIFMVIIPLPLNNKPV